MDLKTVIAHCDNYRGGTALNQPLTPHFLLMIND
jgi:hypothetical protein